MFFFFDKYQHGMYWNIDKNACFKSSSWINTNMGYIETQVALSYMLDPEFDKYQHGMYWNSYKLLFFSRNMG